MKILVTGFEAFNGREENPSKLILEQLVAPSNVEMIKQVLPVEFDATIKIIEKLIHEEKPDVVLSLGQAGNVPHISVERVAINLDNCRSSDGKTELPDSTSVVHIDRPIMEDGESAYFSTLPVWDLVNEVNKAGVPCRLSYSAGTYVCNHVMYLCCHFAAKEDGVRTGFVHVPFLPEQMRESTTGYSMEFEQMLKGVQIIIDYLAGQNN